MTLAIYEDALSGLQDHLPDWWATEFRTDPAANVLLTNPFPNPSFEVDVTSGWSIGNVGGVSVTTQARDTSWSASGGASFRQSGTNTNTSAAALYWQTSPRLPVVAGQTYTWAAQLRVNQIDDPALSGFRFVISWYDATGTQVSTNGASAFYIASGRITYTATAPAGAVSVLVRMGNYWSPSATLGRVLDANWDSLIMGVGNTAPPYFDGSAAFGPTTAWQDAPNNSPSLLYDRDPTPDPQSNLYIILSALADSIDGLSGDLESLHADMALVNATLDGLRREYAYAFGIDYEQLPPTSDALRSYIQLWAATNGSTQSIVNLLTQFLETPVNTTGTQLVFDAGGAGLTFPANGSGLVMFQTVQTVAALTFPVDNSGITLDPTLTFPNASGWVLITEDSVNYRWTVTTKSYLTFDRAAFARAVERLRQAHLLPATIIEVST